jgi:hypothetical protein
VLISDRARGLLVLDVSGVVDPGDYNQDMQVDPDDYSEWASAFGSTRSSVHDAPLADGNFNGIIDAADYVVWRKFADAAGAGGALAGGETSVPEPNAMLLVLVGTAFMFARRQSRTT